LIKVENFEALETKILSEIHGLDVLIDVYNAMEFYSRIPALQYKRKRQIEFYTDMYFKYKYPKQNTNSCSEHDADPYSICCEQAKEIILKTEDRMQKRQQTEAVYVTKE